MHKKQLTVNRLNLYTFKQIFGYNYSETDLEHVRDMYMYFEHLKQEMSLKKTNGVGLKKEKKYLYINLTQMTETLE